MLWHEAATRSADQSVGTRGRRSRRILHWFSGCRICSLFNTAASVQRFISPATGTMCFRDPRASRVRGSPRCSQPGVTIDPSVKVRLLPLINPAQSRIRPDIWSTDVSEIQYHWFLFKRRKIGPPVVPKLYYFLLQNPIFHTTKVDSYLLLSATWLTWTNEVQNLVLFFKGCQELHFLFCTVLWGPLIMLYKFWHQKKLLNWEVISYFLSCLCPPIRTLCLNRCEGL